MTASACERQRHLSTLALLSPAYDLTAKYMAVSHLQSLAETEPGCIDPNTVRCLENLFHDDRIARQVQAFFLYRTAAEILTGLVTRCPWNRIGRLAFQVLKASLGKGGDVHRAAAEALGSMPVSIAGPRLPAGRESSGVSISWESLVSRKSLGVRGSPTWIGRSLVAPIADSDRLFVVKMGLAEAPAGPLFTEVLWDDYLQQKASGFSVRFDVPLPLRVAGNYLFHLRPVPHGDACRHRIDPQARAICFIANRDYFDYPNHPDSQALQSPETFGEIMLRSAYLLGGLTGQGLVHQSPIALFHNRTQRHRRADRGCYHWARAGRLDRWLDSCRYPNIAPTGVRDLEHMACFQGSSRRLYFYVGNHLLSLLLIAGSYFRSRDPSRIGTTPSGKAVDARDLFDPPFFKVLVRGIFTNYYQGFVGESPAEALPFDIDRLTARMIDEMGVDRYMDEVLRIQDQEEMTEETFRALLQDCGVSADEARSMQKGERDIVLQTGPHLGGFNDRISIPELIEAVASFSALCMAGRWARDLAAPLCRPPAPRIERSPA